MTNEFDDIPTVGIKETIEVIQGGTAKPLTDIYSIEASLDMIAKAEEKIENFKELKKLRIAAIDFEIENQESRVEFLKSIIKMTLQAHKKKNLSFPGLAKVSQSMTRPKWVITDEAKLLEVLDTENETSKVVKTEKTILKGELNKLLDVWDNIKKLPDCVTKVPAESSIKITWEKNEVSDVAAVPVVKKDAPASGPDLDLNLLDFTSTVG